MKKLAFIFSLIMSVTTLAKADEPTPLKGYQTQILEG